ncbi:Keratin, type II cytoskeletal 8 [Tupaia chinensis]|uniref:Keratin, type II cytoskeletal 8 n=1 Tax=Tupaia chinensis TaxID=246437 RepID=L9LD88_TUPCH|nr:Keratin, type II cytoskeletal 8 [Tupaia chinensis]
MDKMFENYINNLCFQLDTLGQERLKLEVELGNRLGLAEDFKNKSYMNKVELESRLEGLTIEIDFLRHLYEEEIRELQSQISDTSVVLPMDNSPSLDVDGIIAEVRTHYEEIANHSWAEAENMCPIKYEELQLQAGKHWDDLWRTKTEISEMNQNISRLQAEIEGLKGQRASLEPAIADAEQCGELAINDANAKELKNVKLGLDIEITTYCKVLEGEESWLESRMQNMSIHTKTTNGYSGGLTYGGLTSPSLNYGLSAFQSSFNSGGGSKPLSRTSSTKVMVVKKIETREGKLVSESSDVLPK